MQYLIEYEFECNKFNRFKMAANTFISAIQAVSVRLRTNAMLKRPTIKFIN